MSKDSEPSLYQKILWAMFAFAANRLRPCSTFRCANRSVFTYHHQKLKMQITFWDLAKPEGYSRVELVQMLETIRTEEAKQSWKTPEPSLSENP